MISFISLNLSKHLFLEKYRKIVIKMNTNKRHTSLIRQILCLAVIASLAGCAVTPKVLDNQGQDEDQVFMRKVIQTTDDDQTRLSFGLAIKGNLTHNVAEYTKPSIQSASFPNLVIAAGDVLKIRINDMEKLDGLYQVTANGELELPFAESLKVSGLSRRQAIDTLEKELVRLNWFYSDQVQVELSAVKLAPVMVSVTGAVFNSGRVSVNNRPTAKAEEMVQRVGGGFSQGRDIIAGINAAGGLRPDADIANIYIKRNNQVIRLNLTPLIDGKGNVTTPQLTSGDQLYIPSTGIESIALIKPSQVTPPGLRLFLSNLIAPSLSNAQGAVGSDSTRLPYGSSLLDSAVSANCVGGTHSANASRSVLFITRNYGNQKQLVISRSINQLLAKSSDRTINPFVMPNDAVACYDSKFTNFRDVARGIGELINPILLGRLL